MAAKDRRDRKDNLEKGTRLNLRALGVPSRLHHSKTTYGVVGIAAFVLVVSLFLFWRGGSPSPPSSHPGLTESPTGSISSRKLRQPPSTTTSSEFQLNAWNHLHSVIEALRKSNSAQSSRRILAELEAALAAMPKADSSKAIQGFLASGADVQTQIEFEVGDGGRLQGANTFRVFLLDYLGQTNPHLASEIARTILSKPEAPDEWAVCLRNYARANASRESHESLVDRLRVLLTHPPWRQSPTTGYLEAFDVAVHLRGGELVPDLARLLLMTNHPAAAHASNLALDRLAINDPVPVLSALASDAGLMQGREATRAGYFARADVSNPDQRRLIEAYLTNPALKPVELDAFVDLFPNENYRISRNLLTVTPPRPGVVIKQRDRETLRVVEEWMQQERFKEFLPRLEIIRNRLREFTKP